jgi:GMP synthase-like glutamine amidotransferase
MAEPSLNISNRTRILYIQARKADDKMIEHEKSCIQKRLSDHSDLDITFHNAYLSPPSPELLQTHNALILGGSGDFSVHHKNSREWVRHIEKLLTKTLDSKLPGFGICFGHQLLGQVMGATVDSEPTRSEIGTVQVSLTETGATDLVFGTLPERFAVQTGHSDSVTTIPKGIELMGRNEQLETQAFKVSDLPFYSTQFHPDLTGDEAQGRYDAYRDVFNKCSGDSDGSEDRVFQKGTDISTSLLSAFVHLVVLGTKQSKTAHPVSGTGA